MSLTESARSVAMAVDAAPYAFALLYALASPLVLFFTHQTPGLQEKRYIWRSETRRRRRPRRGEASSSTVNLVVLANASSCY